MLPPDRGPLQVAARLAALAAVAVSCRTPPPAPAIAEGVVVEAVDAAGSAAKAGLRTGDVLLSWRRASVSGPLRSPFDPADVEMEEAPLGGLILDGRRGAEPVAFVPAAGEWKVDVRPRLRRDLLDRYLVGRQLVAEGRIEQAQQAFGDLVRSLDETGDVTAGCWALARLARGLAQSHRGPEARAAYERARERAEAAGDARLAATLARSEADCAQDESDLARAEALERSALARLETLRPRSFAVAATLHSLGAIARKSGDLAGARALLDRALALRRGLAPEGLEVATTLNQLGIVDWYQGSLDRAERRYAEASAIFDRAAPGSLAAANVLNNLGLVVRDRGDLAAAEDHLRRALRIREAQAPGSRDVGANLLNLGAVANDRGDLEAATRLDAQALALFEKLAPDGLEVAITLNNLGTSARDAGDLEAAETHVRRSLAIRERIAPRSLDLATSLSNLGGLLFDRGKLAEAEQLHRRALALRQSLAPESLAVATSLTHLAAVAEDRGDLGEARRLLEDALARQRRTAPGGRDVGESLNQLAEVLRQQGDLPAAEAGLREALAIRVRLTPASMYVAESWNGLGRVLAATGRGAAATDAFRRAVDAFEAQQSRVGGPDETREAFAAHFAAFYRDLVDALVDRGDEAAAFHVLEHSRARRFLALLAERDLTFPGDIPPALARERRLLDRDYERTQEQLAGLEPATQAAEVEELAARLRDLRRRQASLAERLRAVSPRLAALQYPQPLDLAEARDALDPGTVLLAYSVGPERTRVFVVRAGADARGPSDRGLAVLTLPVGEGALRSRVRLFRGLVERGRSEREPEPALLAEGGRLYDDLVRPAEADLAGAARVLVSADGPLHTLPFAALVRSRSPLEYLAEWKPLHAVLSATVYAELRRSRHPRPPDAGPLLAALADPAYDTRRSHLPRLPATRAEALAIAALFPGRAQVALGPDATEDRARLIGPGPRYVHFACHALLDPRSPLDAALALTPGDGDARENGNLQAWEILESVRLEADLVALSACETGLGRERGGEGLVGLSRAFQYAGARSVMASLWAVSDRSTVELMQRFYAGLRAGLPKDQALQAAERALIHGAADGRHPFRWAAFEVIGDWR